MKAPQKVKGEEKTKINRLVVWENEKQGGGGGRHCDLKKLNFIVVNTTFLV